MTIAVNSHCNAGFLPGPAVAWFEPVAVQQLNIFSIQHDRDVQDILMEAINEWFAKQGLQRFDAEN